MARNIANYISNLGKSVAYSSIDRLKNVAPSSIEFANTNAELFKEVYSSFRDYRTTYSRGIDSIKKTKVYEATEVGMKAIFEDIATGRFYNKRRDEELMNKAVGMSDLEDDFNFSFDDEDDSWDDSDITDESSISDIESSSRSNAEMVSMTVASTGQQIIENQKIATNLLYTQSINSTSILNNNLNVINSNLGKVLEYSTINVQTHLENSKKYFEESTNIQKAQLEVLTNIAKSIVKTDESNNKNKERTDFNSITGAEGTPDLRGYIQAVRNNLSNMSGGASSLVSIMGENSNSLLSLVSSPLKFIPDFVSKILIPNTLEETIKQFDSSIGGIFGSIIAKFNNMAQDEDNILNRTIGKMFGLKFGISDSIDTQRYEKGKVDFDGKTRKSIIEVIPTQLGKIISLLSGNPEQIYDYDKGAFVSGDLIKSNYENILESSVKSATSDMRDEFDKFSNLITFNTLQEKEEFNKDIDNFFTALFKKGHIFDYNSKDISATDYNVSQDNFDIIKSFFKNTDYSLQHNINKNILQERDSLRERYEELQNSGDSIYNNLFNNSNLNEFVNQTSDEYTSNDSIIARNNILTTLDNKGKNVFYYLQNIYKELTFIRMKGTGSSKTLNKNINKYSLEYGDKSISIDDNITSIDDIKIENSNHSKKYYDYLDNKDNKYIQSEQERIYKNDKENIVNVSNLYDNITNRVDNAISIHKINEDITKEHNKKKTIFDKLTESENLTDKMKVVTNKISDLSKKPLKFVTSVIKKADQRMYELIYGKQEEGKTVKGFLDAMIFELKKTFKTVNTWIDEKILNPINKKLEVESFKEAFNNVLEKTGLKDLGKSIKTYLFGESDSETGVLSGFTNAIKNGFTNAKDIISNSLSTSLSPVLNKFKSERRLSFESLDVENQKEDIDEYKPRNIYENLNEYNKMINQRNDLNNLDKYKKQLKDLESKDSTSIDEINSLKDKIHSISNIDTTYDELNKQIKDFEKEGIFEYKKDETSKKLSEILGLTDRRLKSSLFDELFNKISDKEESSIDNLTGKQLIDSLYILSKKDKTNRNVYAENILKMEDYFNNIFNGDRNVTLKDIISNNAIYEKPKTRSIEELQQEYQGLINLANEDNFVEQPKKLEFSWSEKINGVLGYLKTISETTLKILYRDGGDGGSRTIKPINPNIPNINVIGSNISEIEEDKAMIDFGNNLGKMLSKTIIDYMRGNVPKYAEGGYIDSAKVATIGKGEMVLNKEHVKALQDIVSEINSGLTSGKKSSKIASRVYSDVYNIDKTLGGIYDSETLFKDVASKINPKDMDSSLIDRQNKILETLSNIINKNHDRESKESVGFSQSKVFEKVYPVVQQSIADLTNGARLTGESLFGKDSDKSTKAFGNVIKDTTRNISEYAPNVLGGGLVGGGISLVTGAIGGPLLGASVGAGIALTKKSEAMQQWLFGKEINGERQGGIIPSKYLKNLNKFMPDMTAFGITGGLAGLLPILPFGPLGGLMLGSTLGFMKNSESVQKSLFGDDKLLSVEKKEQLKKVLPKVGMGALAGAFFGPFGILGNSVLGAGIGLASTTEKFNEAIFGKKSEITGEYEGGFFPMLRNLVVKPIKNYTKGLGKRVNTFFKERVFKRIESAIDPISKTIKKTIDNTFGAVGRFINDMLQKSVGAPLATFVKDKLIRPFTKAFSGIFNFAKGAVKGVFEVPAMAIEGVGNKLRRKHVIKGDADYMSAEERLQFRKDKNIKNDKFSKVDEIISNLSDEDIVSVRDSLSGILDTKSYMKKERTSKLKNISNDIAPYLGYNQTKDIMKSIQKGKYSSAVDSIKNADLAPEIKQTIFENLSSYANLEDKKGKEQPKNEQEAKDYLAKYLKDGLTDYSKYDDSSKMQDAIREDLISRLNKQGIKISDTDKDFNKYINLFEGELRQRSKKTKQVNQEASLQSPDIKVSEKHHSEIVDLFTTAIQSINDMKEALTVDKEIHRDVLYNSEIVETILNNGDTKQEESFNNSHTINLLKEEISESKDDNESNLINHITEDGKVIQLRKASNGDYSANLSDSGTRKALEEDSEEDTIRHNFYETMIANSTIDLPKAEEDKRSMLEKILSSFGSKGIFGSIFSVLKTIGLGMAFITGGKFLQNILSKKNAGVKGSANEDITQDEEGNYFDKDGNPLSESDAKKKMFLNNLSRGVGYENSSDATMNIASTTTKGLIKGVPKFATNLGKGIPIVSTLTAPLRGAGKVINKIRELPSSLSSVTSKFKGMFNKQVATKAINETAETATKTGLISVIKNKLSDILLKIFNSKAVQNLIGTEPVQKIINKAIPEILEQVGKVALKESGESIIKVVGGFLSGGIINAVFAVADFIYGFAKAKTLLSITDSPSLGQRCIAGLVHALSGFFVVTSFIPTQTWINLFMDNILPCFTDIESSKLYRQRKEAESELNAYNEANNSDYTLESYQKEVKSGSNSNNINDGTTSIPNTGTSSSSDVYGPTISTTSTTKSSKGVWQTVKDTTSNVWNSTKKVASNVWTGTKNAVSNAWNFVTSPFKKSTGGANITQANFINNLAKSKTEVAPIGGAKITESNFINNLAKSKTEVAPIGGAKITESNFVNNLANVKTEEAPKGGSKITKNKFRNNIVKPKNIEKFGIGGPFVFSDEDQKTMQPTNEEIISNPKLHNLLPIKNISEYNRNKDKQIKMVNENTNSPIPIERNTESEFGVGGSKTKKKDFSKLPNKKNNVIPFNKKKKKKFGIGGDKVTKNDFLKNFSGNDFDDNGVLKQELHSEYGVGKGSGTNGNIALGKFGNASYDKYDSQIQSASKKYGLKPNRIKAIAMAESSMRADIGPNSAGAVGLMQITKSPMSHYGYAYNVAKMKDPAFNLDVGSRYYSEMLKTTGGDYNGASIAYNAGPGYYQQYKSGKKKLYSETSKYLTSINNYHSKLLSNGGQDKSYSADGSISVTNDGSSSGGFATGNDIITTARGKLGKPYVWGATGPDSFDCSGLTQWAYKQHGINLSRTTYTQVNEGTSVDKNDLQVGDLVFTRGTASRPEHVGIYSGNDKMVHASGANGAPVIEGAIHDYKTARRILTGSNGTGSGGSSSSSSSDSSSNSSSSDKPSLLNMFSDLGTAITNDINKFFGFETESNDSSSDSSNSGDSSVSGDEGTVTNNPPIAGTGAPATDWFTRTAGGVTFAYGRKYSSGKAHVGIDFGKGSKFGTPIKSPVAGKVIKATKQNNSYGNHVFVEDKKGGKHIFAHMDSSSPIVKVGDTVKIGTKIGGMGSSGNSTGLHLHYETRNSSGTVQNPDVYLNSLYPNNELGSYGSGLNTIFNPQIEQESSNDGADNYFTNSLGGIVTSGFGEKRGEYVHSGVDYGASEGTPIQSPISGIVQKVKSLTDSYGEHVIIKDDNGSSHYFGHLRDRSNLKEGQRISSGDLIGEVGSTGNSTGSHLHYEVRNKSGKFVDPNSYLSTTPYGIGGKDKLPEVKAPKVEIPKKADSKEIEKKGFGIGSGVSDYTTLLTTIIKTLLTISDNSACIGKIVEILTAKFGEDLPSETTNKLKSINSESSSAKTQMINVIRNMDSNITSTSPENEYLLNVLDQLAIQ